MFAKSADVEEIKDLVKSLSRSVEELTTEVELLKREVKELKEKDLSAEQTRKKKK
jgi:cell division protein FtsB